MPADAFTQMNAEAAMRKKDLTSGLEEEEDTASALNIGYIDPDISQKKRRSIFLKYFMISVPCFWQTSESWRLG